MCGWQTREHSAVKSGRMENGRRKMEEGRMGLSPLLRERKRRSGEECLGWFPTVSETADIRSKVPSAPAGPPRDAFTVPANVEDVSADAQKFRDQLSRYRRKLAGETPPHRWLGGYHEDTFS